MTAEQLIVAMMTSRCPDKNLKMELLKEKLTMDDVYDKVQQHQSARKTVNKPQEIAAATNKYYWCDRTGHSQASCWTDKTFCRKCGKTRHIAKKCRVQPSQTKGTKENQKSTIVAEDYNCDPTPKLDS